MREAILTLQTVSLQVAYSVSEIFLNINNYIKQVNGAFNTGFNTGLGVGPVTALLIFFVIFMAPNLYVFISLYLMKKDLLNGGTQPDVRIKAFEDHIDLGGKKYILEDDINKPITGAILLLSPFIVDFRSLPLVLLYLAVLAIIGYTGRRFVTHNPYLLLKYDVFVLRSDRKKVYIILEKEKEFERPKLNSYIIDWYLGHSVLIGFKRN